MYTLHCTDGNEEQEKIETFNDFLLNTNRIRFDIDSDWKQVTLSSS